MAYIRKSALAVLAFLAGLACANLVPGWATRDVSADRGAITIEPTREGVRFTAPAGKSYLMLVAGRRGGEARGLVFHEGSVDVATSELRDVRLYELNTAALCEDGDCKPCEGGNRDACTLPPPPPPPAAPWWPSLLLGR